MRIFISFFIKKDGSILVIFDQVLDILLVAFGAVFGANIRFLIYKKFQKLDINKYFSIVIINSLASFFLGFFLSILPRISYYHFSYQLTLFFSIGLLGSLSTFSTFVYDLFEIFFKLSFFRALKLFLISFSLGIIAVSVGFVLGNL